VSRLRRASRGGGAGIKDAARRLRRSPAAILDTGTTAARCDCVAGTKERRLWPNKGTWMVSGVHGPAGCAPPGVQP